LGRRGRPVGGAGQVALPEWPGPALPRPHRIDGAAHLAVVKHAVAVDALLERPALAVRPRVEAGDFFQRFAAELGDGANFVVRHPDEPGPPGAAVAAPRTGEAQAVGEPGLRH